MTVAVLKKKKILQYHNDSDSFERDGLHYYSDNDSLKIKLYCKMTDSFEKYISTWMMADLKTILCSTTITAASSFEKGILHYCNDSDSLGKVIWHFYKSTLHSLVNSTHTQKQSKKFRNLKERVKAEKGTTGDKEWGKLLLTTCLHCEREVLTEHHELSTLSRLCWTSSCVSRAVCREGLWDAELSGQ